jgi:hypothetical protein
MNIKIFILQFCIAVWLTDIQNYSFACGAVWVWNLVSEIKGGTQTEGVWEQGAEGNIWTEEGLSDRRLEETA